MFNSYVAGTTNCPRLLFAGEHTIKKRYSTTAGAYLSGEREAARVLAWRRAQLAARAQEARVAIVTSSRSAVVDADVDLTLLTEALTRAGVKSHVVVPWESADASVVLRQCDAVVVACTSHGDAAFLQWASRVDSLENPLELLRWNSDKHYLLDLHASGVPLVSTPDEHDHLTSLVFFNGAFSHAVRKVRQESFYFLP